MTGATYNSDPFISPDLPATDETLTKKNYTDTYFYGLPITATPPIIGQSPVLNGTADGWDWQYFSNPTEILYQTFDVAQGFGNIIYRIGSEDEASSVECSPVEIDMVTTGIVNISGSAGASVFSGAGVSSLIGVGGVHVTSFSDMELKILGGGDFKFNNLNTASSSNILYIDPITGIITKNTPPSSGTVTSVSITTANGISGTVLTATTTPAISLTLGAITPSSVSATGTVTGSNLSGINNGDQTITLTGAITGSGTGSFITTISDSVITTSKIVNSAVTYSKLQNESSNSLLGNPTGSSASPSEIPLNSTLSFSAGLLQRSALTGDSIASAGSNVMSVVGLRGIPLNATVPNFGQGYIYLPGGLNFLPVDINWLLDQSITQNTASSVLATEQTIYTNNIPTGFVSILGQSLNFEFSGTFNNTTTIKFYFGSIVTPIFSFPTTAPTVGNTSFVCKAKIVRRTSTTAYAVIEFIAGDSLTITTTPIYYISNAQASTGINFVNSMTWKLTGTSTVAINSLTGYFYRVNFGA